MSKVLWKDKCRPETDTSSQKATWTPHVLIIHEDLAALSKAVAEATPSNARLLELTRKSPPPEAWWQEESDPFTPQQSAD